METKVVLTQTHEASLIRVRFQTLTILLILALYLHFQFQINPLNYYFSDLDLITSTVRQLLYLPLAGSWPVSSGELSSDGLWS